MIDLDIAPLLEGAGKFGLKAKHITELLGIAPAAMSRASSGAQNLTLKIISVLRI